MMLNNLHGDERGWEYGKVLTRRKDLYDRRDTKENSTRPRRADVVAETNDEHRVEYKE
jgi:hypothetical protein